MSVLKKCSEEGILKEFLDCVAEDIETRFECTVSAWNMVLETEVGHCVVSFTREREEV